MAIRFGVSFSIKGFDEMRGCELLRLSHVHSMKDEALKFCHVTHKEETSCDAYRLIFMGRSRCVHVSMEVYQPLLILAIIIL